MLAGVQESFAEGARMLDVGTGVAAMAVAYAELFPRLTVVGIDVIPRVLRLAEQTVAASSVGDRIILREQDVSALDESDMYAFAWLPAPFIPESVLGAGVLRVVESLQAGGWLMLGHGKYGGSAVNDAIGRFKTIAYGGTALDDGDADGCSGPPAWWRSGVLQPRRAPLRSPSDANPGQRDAVMGLGDAPALLAGSAVTTTPSAAW